MEEPERNIAYRTLIFLAFACAAMAAWSYAFVPLRASQDEWWHLKTGQWIWQHRALPQNDIFTYTGESKRWYNHEWLSQLAFFGAYRLGEGTGFGGVRALVMFKTVVVVVTFALLAWLMRLRRAPWAAIPLMTFLAAEISRRTIYPRPPIFSYLLLVIFLLVLYGWKLGHVRRRWLWSLPLLTVLWGNLHGMVLLAIIAVGAFATGEWIDKSRYGIAKGSSPFAAAINAVRAPGVLHMFILLAATVIAAMLQPSGYHLFFLGKNFTADPLLSKMILEMLPPPFFLPKAADGHHVLVPGFATFWICAAALPLMLLWNRGKFPFGADYLLAGFFLYQGVMHWRLLPLFAISSAPAAAALIRDIASRFGPAVRDSASYFAAGITIVLSGLFVFKVDENGTFFSRNRQLVRGHVMSQNDYPTPLLDFIIKADLPDRMFSESNYCGYYMWRLSPERHRLFTDNRFDLFGSEFLIQEKNMLAAANKGDRLTRDSPPLENDWDELLDKWGINFIVIHRDPRPPGGNPLQLALMKSGKWTDVYYYIPPNLRANVRQLDPKWGTSVWLRNDPKFEQTKQRALHLFREENPELPLPAELDDYLLRDPAVLATAPPHLLPRTTTNSTWRVPTGK